MLRDTPRTVYLKEYRPPEFLIDTVDLRFELGEEETRVHSRLALRRNPAAESRSPDLFLNGEGLELLAISMDGRRLDAARYRLDDEGLTLIGVPDRFTLETEARIYPQKNTALEGLYRSGGMFCTQCEAEGFRHITWYLDRPDVMARFSTEILAERARYPVLLSNGNPVEEASLDDGRHRVRWEDPFPKPCYLFALVAGDLERIEDSFTTASGRNVALRIFVEKENVEKCDHAMRSLKKAMRWDEQEYGREYDLDIYMIVAVNDFNMGAMENKGLNIFNSKYVLARPETATDQDFQGIEGVIAHEYFHNWTGNRITCRDWFQLSLKEGFTVFRDQEFSADMGSRGVKRIEDVRLLRAHQFAEDASPMAHPVRPESYIEINNFYTVTVYEKGAEVVRMQRNLLGRETFRKATDLYFERFDGQAVTTDDFVRCMEDASGRDLTQFRRWYSQAGTPEVSVDERWDAAAGRYTLTLRQSCPPTPGQPHKEPFHIPFALGLLDSDGRDLPVTLAGETAAMPGTRMLELREPEERFEFAGLAERPVPSLLRGFSAPVKVRFNYSDAMLTFLMAHDSDPFNRWDAAQTLAQRVLLAQVTARADGQPMMLPEEFAEAFRLALVEEGGDQALQAEVLTLPSESYLGDQMAVVDVDGIHAARLWTRVELAGRLSDTFHEVYGRNAAPVAFSIEPADIARRRLRNLCLAYLAEGEGGAVLCLDHYRTANTMTDTMAALGALTHLDAPERGEALAAFEARWRDDPLVMDKWFAVQAVSRLPDTLDRVRALMAHPAFSLRNPNKVRSLIGAFCNANPVRFHDVSGEGYRFLADQVLALDPLNPQIAARLLRAMARWRRYDEPRQRLMQAQLERIMAAKVSKDVYEIAAKSLQAPEKEDSV